MNRFGGRGGGVGAVFASLKDSDSHTSPKWRRWYMEILVGKLLVFLGLGVHWPERLVSGCVLKGELRWKHPEVRDAGLLLGVRIVPWTRFLEARGVGFHLRQEG